MYTPGPWVAQLTSTSRGNVWTVVGSEAIVRVYSQVYGGSPKDNAHLIAAAPDLLAALEAVQYLIPSDEGRNVEERLMIIEAIAKAKGI